MPVLTRHQNEIPCTHMVKIAEVMHMLTGYALLHAMAHRGRMRAVCFDLIHPLHLRCCSRW